MPFLKESFDSVQADFLLDQIQTPEHITQSYMQVSQRFFKEVFDILKHGGMMVLAEPILPRGLDKSTYTDSNNELDYQKINLLHNMHRGNMENLLKQIGFSSVAVNSGESLVSRRDLDRYIMLGNTWELPKESVTTAFTTSIVAIK